jgi:hypothetical protein
VALVSAGILSFTAYVAIGSTMLPRTFPSASLPGPGAGVDCDVIVDVRQHLAATLFEPFTIVTSSGHRYAVASADHAGVHPRGSRVVVWFDDDSGVILAALHIVAIEKNGSGMNGLA